MFLLYIYFFPVILFHLHWSFVMLSVVFFYISLSLHVFWLDVDEHRANIWDTNNLLLLMCVFVCISVREKKLIVRLQPIMHCHVKQISILLRTMNESTRRNQSFQALEGGPMGAIKYDINSIIRKSWLLDVCFMWCVTCLLCYYRINWMVET